MHFAHDFTYGNVIVLDENECLDNPCDHDCTDTQGSFRCHCPTGWRLQEDGRTCKGMFIDMIVMLISNRWYVIYIRSWECSIIAIIIIIIIIWNRN